MASVQKRLVLDDVVQMDPNYRYGRVDSVLAEEKITRTARVSDKRRPVTLTKGTVPKFSLIQGIINDYRSLDIKADVGIIDVDAGQYPISLSTLKLLKAIALNSQSPCFDYAQACSNAYMEIVRQALSGQKPMIIPTDKAGSEFESHVFAEIMFFYVDECN